MRKPAIRPSRSGISEFDVSDDRDIFSPTMSDSGCRAEVRFDDDTGYVLGPPAEFVGGPSDGRRVEAPHPPSRAVGDFEYEIHLNLVTGNLTYQPAERPPRTPRRTLIRPVLPL